MQGWVKTHRCIMTKGIWDNAHMFKVFSWCIMKASHKDHKQLVGRTTVNLKRGQFVTGRKKASIELNMKESTAWDYLKVLESNESINIKSNSKFSVVTVENYSFYQSEEEKTDSKPDNKSTANQQQINTNKNVKNDENEKKYKEIYDYYLTLDLVKHKNYTQAMAKAIKKAMDENKYTVEDCKKLLKRHEAKVKASKNKDYPVKARPLHEFFGQKAYGATYLICVDYDDGMKHGDVKVSDKPKGKKVERKIIYRDEM